MDRTKHTTATAAILFATILWGMTFAFIKDAVSFINPFTLLFWRFSLASILFTFLFFQKIEFKNKNAVYKGVQLGICLSGTVIFQTIGLHYTAASTASFITSLSVILVTLLMCFLEKKWPTMRAWIAAIFAITGVAFITVSHGMVANQGDLWVFLCAVCFAAYIILAGKFSQDQKPLTLTWTQLVTVALISGFILITTHQFEIPQKTNIWIDIFFCAFFASIIAFSLQLHYQQYVSASKTAIIFSAEPIFATITATIYLNESINLQFIVGATLIFAGILLSEKKTNTKMLVSE